jgi:hypothetical protein
MHHRCRSVARGSLVAVATSLVLAACGESGGRIGEEASPTAAATTEPASRADPLEGEWRQEFACEDAVRAVEQADVKPAQFNQWLAEMPILYGGTWDPSVDRPCAGAPRSFDRLARFEEGNLTLFEGSPMEIGAETTYEIVDDHTFTANIDGLRTFEFQIEGARLMVDVLEDGPWLIATWEATPFERVN